jgi:small-conductance mechanosensitive channel
MLDDDGCCSGGCFLMIMFFLSIGGMIWTSIVSIIGIGAIIVVFSIIKLIKSTCLLFKKIK